MLADQMAFTKVNPEVIVPKMRSRNVEDCRNLLNREEWENAGFRVRVLGISGD